MNAYVELAKMFKQRDNRPTFSPVFGKIIRLPELQIQLNPRVLLQADDIKAVFDIYETVQHDDGSTEYVNLNREIVLLPYSEYQKFIALGVVV